jgi:murein L,D-transpeptidase YcbB/YkuD
MRLPLLALMLTGLMLTGVGCKSKSVKSLLPGSHARKATSKPNTTDYAANVQQVVAAPKLAMLRWPDTSEVHPAVQQFYDDRNEELAWTRELRPTKAATQLLELFSDAAAKGLNPEDYDADRWPQRLQRLEAIRASKDGSESAQNDVAEFDVALTVAALRYLEDLHTGRVNPESLNFDIDVPGKRAGFDVATLLNDQIVDAEDVAAEVAKIEPQNPMYMALERALPEYIKLAKEQDAPDSTGWNGYMKTPLPALPAGAKSVAPGGTYAGLGPLMARLYLEGYIGYGNGEIPATYPASIAEFVKQYQARHGLLDDGKIGPGTIDAMNVPLRVRVQQMDDALERWRWLPDNYVQPRVLVNLPEFQLRAYDAEHTLAFKMRVVDGESKGHDTPMFVRQMRYVVFRPYWNLPASIVKKEIVPHLQKSGVGYLAAHGYEVTSRDGTVVSGVSVGDIAHLRYMVRQRPGPANSLGLVKFLFPNEYDVYMHSTPELNLFALARRDKSHGCVRLQHADQMALWVLGGDQHDPATQTAWDPDKIKDAMSDEEKNNKTIGLKTPLPVVITYLTANADEDGTMHFFADVYGYDKQLEEALAKGRPYAQGPMKINPTLIVGETE